jgi:hypothetical protein
MNRRKGTMAVGSGGAGLVLTVLAAVGALPEPVAITLIVTVGAVAVAYIVATSDDDGRSDKPRE